MYALIGVYLFNTALACYGMWSLLTNFFNRRKKRSQRNDVVDANLRVRVAVEGWENLYAEMKALLDTYEKTAYFWMSRGDSEMKFTDNLIWYVTKAADAFDHLGEYKGLACEMRTIRDEIIEVRKSYDEK